MRHKSNILIVDDDQFIRQILERIVTREGYLVDCATDGLEALQILEQKKYDFVISDVKMPNMDGIELLKNIKEKYPLIKVLLITGYSGDFTAKDAIRQGADSYIVKPFKNGEISSTLRKLALKELVPSK